MNWQPISTAPKDGTVVDLWCEYYRMPDCLFIHGEWRQMFGESPEEFDIVIGKPTHWMPLPEPPEGNT